MSCYSLIVTFHRQRGGKPYNVLKFIHNTTTTTQQQIINIILYYKDNVITY
jgi:hypothetical protein